MLISATMLRDQINDGDFRRSENPDRRPPGACPAADVQALTTVTGESSRIGKGHSRYQPKGKDLPLVGMTGKLEVNPF